jgi:hypothetical protein
LGKQGRRSFGSNERKGDNITFMSVRTRNIYEKTAEALLTTNSNKIGRNLGARVAEGGRYHRFLPEFKKELSS